MNCDGANSYAYNAESEIKTAAGVTNTYDGDGNRIEKSSGKIYRYGAETEILDESDTSGNFSNEYVFFGGKRVAMRVVSSGSFFFCETIFTKRNAKLRGRHAGERVRKTGPPGSTASRARGINLGRAESSVLYSQSIGET
ncbi:MAG TPA: hypothetical protein VKS20_04265 [Candidatus Acidoferrales bacterium]|nr:hypothetical protein [Candidatus Acidoferrales bacterium]